MDNSAPKRPLDLVALIYLWTRDAELSVSRETEDYVIDHFRKTEGKVTRFSDKARAAMAERIARILRR